MRTCTVLTCTESETIKFIAKKESFYVRNRIHFFNPLFGSFCSHRGTDKKTKGTIQPNNKALKITLLFGSFDSFVMSVPGEKPNIFYRSESEFACKVIIPH